MRDRLRVLLVSGEPHPGERTWRNLLKADASVDLVHFTILRPPEKQDGTPTKELALIAFPTRELFVDKLDEFDLVIFDRYRRQAVLPAVYMANIARYVAGWRRGADRVRPRPRQRRRPLQHAALRHHRRRPHRRGARRRASSRMLTDAGQASIRSRAIFPGSAGENPAGAAGSAWSIPTPEHGETVMSGLDDKPLLVLSRTGEGRVAQMLSDQGWLWARGFEGGGPQTELLRRMAHWLMKEPDLEEEALEGNAGRQATS